MYTEKQNGSVMREGLMESRANVYLCSDSTEYWMTGLTFFFCKPKDKMARREKPIKHLSLFSLSVCLLKGITANSMPSVVLLTQA